MSLDDLFTNTETIIKGIVYTQIFTLPFSFSLSSGSLILSYGLISNNLKSISLSSNGFDEFNSQIFRAGLQFYLAGFITLVDVLMNFMDLSVGVFFFFLSFFPFYIIMTISAKHAVPFALYVDVFVFVFDVD